MTPDPVAAIVAAATRHLLDPPRGEDPVVRLASADELSTVFERVIPLELGRHVEARDADELAHAAELVTEYSVHTNHPRFFNQNFAGSDPVAVAGDWLATALNTTNATFEAAPVFTLMEASLLRALAQRAGMSADGVLAPGMFAPGGSTATLYALQLARHRRQPDLARAGWSGERLALFVSEAGHYAAKKSAALLGIGMDAVIEVGTDANGAMGVDDLRRCITAATAAGRSPFCVIATSGTTVTSAFDPLEQIADVCGENELWMHVDGCYGGSALFSPAERHRLAGVERADSFVWNLHKMMGMTQQCTALLLADPEQLGRCFATGADYIFQPDKLNADLDTGDRHFQCARRVDSLKLWLAWNAAGDEGFAARVDHAVAMAEHVRARIAESSGEFAPIVEGDFTNVTFTWVPPELRPLDLDALTGEQWVALHELAPRMKAAMQVEGSALLGFQPVNGLNCFRWLFMSPTVTTADVDVVLGLLARYGADAWEAAPSS
ncbi:MAG: pyridoxal phosphate-dependent decarboxylase family protein [Acidimicrobiales bacterium]